MKTKNKIVILIALLILLMIVYLTLDYINITGVLLLNIDRINYDFFSVFVNNLIVISLFLITYFLVDEKNTKAQKNKKEIVKYMLDDDYKTCLRYLELLDDKNQLKILVTNLSKENIGNKYFEELMEVSFKNYNQIMTYSNQGIINIEILKKYLYIKSNYFSTISGYVLSVGMPEKIEKLIEDGHQKLKLVVKEELGQLDKYNWE